MNKKLTLSLDDTVIARAKKYASARQASLSEMVENYFRKITSEYKEESVKGYSETVKQLSGVIRVPEDFDYREERLQRLQEKYLHD